jgi:hypothetical protein
MNNTPQDRHSQMIGRVCREIVANALTRTALVGKPEPQSPVRLSPSGDHRLSQDRKGNQ